MNDMRIDKIANVIGKLRAMGHTIPNQVFEIPGFPCQTFDDLKTKLSTRELILYRPGINYSSDLFALMATPSESLAFNISVVLMYVLPMLTLALAIFVRWPWILACPLVFFAGYILGRAAYSKMIFRSAAASEMHFCFLFYGFKVGVALSDFSQVYVWEGSHPA